MDRVWIYQSKKALSAVEEQEISFALGDFIKRWAAHSKKLDASFEILYNHFIILKVNQEEILASGCSIDDSVRFMQALDKQYGLSLFDRRQMAFIDNAGEVRVCAMDEIPAFIEHGVINDETLIFNNLIQDA